MEFLALATVGADAETRTPAQRQALVEGIDAWFEKHGAEGRIAWQGHQLDDEVKAKTVRVGANGEVVVTDGPFIEAKEGLGGIAAFECASMEEAVEISTAWAADFDLTLELRPIIPM